MNDCQEVRAGVLLRDLAHLERDPVVARHLAECAHCSADVRTVFTATRATAELMNQHAPLGNPAAITASILDHAVTWREERTRVWRRASLALLTTATLMWTIAAWDRAAPLRAAMGFPDAPYVTTVTLTCLGVENAVEVARSYLRTGGSTVVPGPAGAPSVTLSGERHQVAQAEIAIAKLDGRLGTPPPGACPR